LQVTERTTFEGNIRSQVFSDERFNAILLPAAAPAACPSFSAMVQVRANRLAFATASRWSGSGESSDIVSLFSVAKLPGPHQNAARSAQSRRSQLNLGLNPRNEVRREIGACHSSKVKRITLLYQSHGTIV